MPDQIQKRLDEIASIATQALRMAEKNQLDHEAHEEQCELIRQGYREAQERNEKFQAEVMRKVEDGLKLVRESFQISQTDQAATHDKQMSDFNNRLGNSIRTTIEAITTSVTSMRDTLTLTIKAVSDAQVTFATSHVQINKDVNSTMRSLNDRIWSLVIGVSAATILTLLGALGATLTKLLRLW